MGPVLWAPSQVALGKIPEFYNLVSLTKEKINKCQWWTVNRSIRITCIQYLRLEGFTVRHRSYCYPCKADLRGYQLLDPSDYSPAAA